MANMCINYVTCAGRTADIQNLKQTLLNGIEYARVQREATDLGVDLQEGAFFHIELGDETATSLQFNYETKWSPNLLDLASLCKVHSLSAVCEYCECGMALYGTAHVSPTGDIVNDEVPADFMDLIELNDDDMYVFNGVEYETEGDIINEHYDTWKQSNK